MKKIMSMLLVTLFCLGTFAACGGESETTNLPETTNTPESTVPPEATNTPESTVAPETEPETPVTYAKTAYDMAEASKYFKQLGRSYLKDNVLYCDYTLSGFEMNVECEGDIVISIEAPGAVNFEVDIDGEQSRIAVKSGKADYTVAKGLPRGTYTLRLINEQFLDAAIHSVTLTGAAKKTEETATYIEFIGDSITAGCGLLDGTTVADDSTSAYAYTAALLMGSDYNSLGISGMSIAYDPANSVNDRYSVNKRASDGAYTPYRQADLVVVNLGTNDNYQWYAGKRQPDGTNDNSKPANNNSTDGYYTYERFDAAFDKLIADIEKANGENVPILFAFGCMENKSYTMGSDRAKELIAKAQSEGKDWKIVILSTDRGGVQAHPSPKGANKQGYELADFIVDHYASLGFAIVRDVELPKAETPKPTAPTTELKGDIVLDFEGEDFVTYMAGHGTVTLPTGKKNGELVDGMYHNTGNECFFEDTSDLVLAGLDSGAPFAYAISFDINFESFSPSANHTVFNLHSYKEDMTIGDWNKLLTIDPDGKMHMNNLSAGVTAEAGKWYHIEITVDGTSKQASLSIDGNAYGSIGFNFQMLTDRSGFRFGNGGGAKFYVDNFAISKK